MTLAAEPWYLPGMGTSTRAVYVAHDLPAGAAIFSCMAVNQHGYDVLDGWPQKPAVIEWMPRQQGSGHPDWKPDGWAFRDPVTGRIIPRLLRMFGRTDPRRLAAFGFSAGSNSGLRELLRNQADRESLSFVGAVDGLHAAVSDSSIHRPENPKSYFLAWEDQIAPFAEYALRAARGQCRMVITGNNLQEPVSGTTRTPFAMRKLFEWVELQPGILPYNESLTRSFADLGAPLPNFIYGRGDLHCFSYLGTQKADHITQANVIVPRLLQHMLQPLWVTGGLGS